MNITSILLIAFAMSTDAFAAAVGKGSTLHKPSIREALRMGLIFGIIEAITPIIGWFIGDIASSYVSDWDHWIAFTILSALGVSMIWKGFGEDAPEKEKPTRHSLPMLALTAFATSIDAMAVGVTLAFLDVSIGTVAIAIGLATMLMVTIGVMLGRAMGALIGKRAEIAGGMILIIIGSVILYQHLSHAMA